MSKFKVGDKVRVIVDNHHEFEKGEVFKIHHIDAQGDLFDKHGTCVTAKRVELAESKPSNKQRITALENEVAELKVIVHQLRKPSTEVQEALAIDFEADADVLEFEGKQYRKVDREAREGDVVIFTKLPSDSGHDVTKGKPYKVFNGTGFLDQRRLQITDDDNYNTYVYGGGLLGGTPETVDVYELIVEDQPKSPNQLRAEVIGKAKLFVENRKLKNHKFIQAPSLAKEGEVIKCTDVYEVPSHVHRLSEYEGVCEVKFVVNEAKRTIVALFYGVVSKNLFTKGIAKCMPGDVFNEHIGKAIALGRALGLDVSEFEQAVQPTIAVGQIGYVEDAGTTFYVTIISNDVEPEDEQNTIGYVQRNQLPFKIINDTNAQYGGAE